MKYTLLFILLAACNFHRERKVNNIILSEKDTIIQSTFKPINNDDTIKSLLTHAVNGKDTTYEYNFDYINNSAGILYFKSGYIFSKKIKTALVFYTVNDTTTQCDVYSLDAGIWTKGLNSPVMHLFKYRRSDNILTFDDYNFDGYADLYINYYITMGICESFGYLLTYNPMKKTLELHPESINIPNMNVDKHNKVVISKTTDRDNTKWIIKKFKWIKDSLIISSEKTTAINQRF